MAVRFTVEEILGIMSEAPGRLAELTADVPPARLKDPPKAGEWSALEVLGHLRACADVWGDSIATMLAEDHPTIAAGNPRAWIEETDYLDLEFAPSLRAFARQRKELLGVLDGLQPEDWERAATIVASSRLEKNVHSFGDRFARHDLTHIDQIRRIVDG